MSTKVKSFIILQIVSAILIALNVTGSTLAQQTPESRSTDRAAQTPVEAIKDVFNLAPEEIEKELDKIPTEEIVKSLPLSDMKEYSFKTAYYIAKSKRFTEAQRLSTLTTLQRFIGGAPARDAANSATQYEELSSTLDAFADSCPNSLEIALRVSYAYSLYLKWTQPYSFTPESRAIYEDARAKKIKALVRTLPVVRKTIKDDKRWKTRQAVELDSTAFKYYRDLIGTLGRDNSTELSAIVIPGERYRSISLNDRDYLARIRNYRQRERLTPIDGEVDNQSTPALYQSLTTQNALLDEHGEIIFYKTPESFEAATNDGERILALRKELFDAGDLLVRADVLAEEALEASRLFGLNVLHEIVASSYANVSPSPLSKLITDDDLRSLDDAESFVLIGDKPQRITLPEEYAYLKLWRQAFDYAEKVCQSVVNRDANNESTPTPVIMNNEYKVLFALTRTALVKEALLRRNPELISDVDAVYVPIIQKLNGVREQSFDAQLPYPFAIPELTLKQIQKPNVAFYKKSIYDFVDASRLSLVYRNANAAEVVVKRVEFANGVTLETFFDRLRKNPRTGVTSLSQLLSRQLRNNMIEPQDVGVEYFQFQEVKKYNVALEEAKDGEDRLQPISLDALPPGAYLLEATGTRNGERSVTDKAILWVHGLGVLRFDSTAGTELRVFDATSGEPLPNAELDVYRVARPLPQSISSSDQKRSGANKQEARVDAEEAITKLTTTTDQSGKAFITNQERNSLNVGFFVVARRSGDEQFNFGNFLDLQWTSNYPTASLKENQLAFFFMTDRPLYQAGEKALFKCCVHPDRLKELSKREIAYCIYDDRGKTIVEKSGVPLDQYGRFTDSFEIPETDVSSFPSYTKFAIDVGDDFKGDADNDDNSQRNMLNVDRVASFSTLSAPVNPRRFNRYLGYGAICVQNVKEPENLITLEIEPSAESLKQGEPLNVKIRALQNNGEPVDSGVLTCSLTASQHPILSPNPLSVAWNWYYGAAIYDSGLRNDAFNPLSRRVANVELKLNDMGEAEYNFTTSLDAALFPNCATTYELTVMARTSDGKLGRCVRNFAVETTVDSDANELDVPFDIHVEPNVVAPGQTVAIRVERQGATKALARTLDRYGDELRAPELITFQNGVANMKIDVDERMTPDFEIEFYSIVDGELLCATKRVLAPPVSQFLNLDLDYDQAQVQPGATLTARVFAPTDADGKSVGANLFAAYYDVALDARTITAPSRKDPRITMTRGNARQTRAVFSNLANSLAPVSVANKMTLHPIFGSPSGSAFNTVGNSDTVRQVPVDRARVSYKYAGDEYDVGRTFQTAGVDYAKAAINCASRDFVISAGQSEDFEIVLPTNGDDLVVEIVAVDEHGRVGYLRKTIGAGK